MITLDGAQGEGGGQILRTALALSVITGRPFRISRIRANRPKPGLMRQHLACVEAAARIGSAAVEGGTLGSREITFQPGPITPGRHEFKIASAGSTMLLLQTILPPLLIAGASSELVLEGGTHNPFAPPFPFIARAFLPLLRRMGFGADAALERAGFYPNGGGRCRVSVQPAKAPRALRLERDAAGMPFPLAAVACLAGLPRDIGERELAAVRTRLPIPLDRCEIEEHPNALGPGNTLHLIAGGEGYDNVLTGFGSPGVRSEQVAQKAVEAAQKLAASGAAADEHLADQLLLPLALARGGSFTTTQPSSHTLTNIDVIREFLPVRITLEQSGPIQWRIAVEP